MKKRRTHNSSVVPPKKVDPTVSRHSLPRFFHQYVQAGNVTAVEQRLKDTVDFDLSCAKDDDFQLTALHVAAKFGHADVAELLIKYGADVNARDVDLATPLHHATTHAAAPTAKLLIKHGALVDVRDDLERTPLHWAAMHSAARGVDCEAVAKLLIAHGLDVDDRSGNELTPLHMALLNGHATVAELLILCGADIDAPSRHVGTPLYLTARMSSFEQIGSADVCCMRLLINHGAEVAVCGDANGGGSPLRSCAGRNDIQLLLLSGGGCFIV